MSAAEILEELPRLDRAELRKIAERALELHWTEAEREDVAFLEACAREVALMNDAQEAADEALRSR